VQPAFYQFFKMKHQPKKNKSTPQMGITQQNYSINYPHSFSNETHNRLKEAVNTHIFTNKF